MKQRKDDLDEQYQLAGDAVVLAPVSGQIPCQQGILQGSYRFLRLGNTTCGRKALQSSAFRANSLLQPAGKFSGLTGYRHDIAGKSG
jgi:hypothetical protein